MMASSHFLGTAVLVYALCLVRIRNAIPSSEFYEFSEAFGDLKLLEVDDGSSRRLPISVHFPFFDKVFNSLFVNTNGAISFERQEIRYTPLPFPMVNNSAILIAPFWSDVDLRQGGNVWYRELTNPTILSRATRDVREAFSEFQKFTTTWMFIATWDQVPYYNYSSFTTKKNSFQAVLITNGRHSFVIFNYDKITWTAGTDSGGNAEGLGGIEAECGYNAGDGKNFYSINRSNRSNILDLSINSNVNKSGVWMFRVDNAKIISQGCNIEGYLTISPNSGSMLGGENVKAAGPCFKPTDKIVCKFDNVKSPGGYLDDSNAICTVPMVHTIKRMALKISLDNGESFPFHGEFQHDNVEKKRPDIIRVAPLKWKENQNVEIKWTPRKLGKDPSQKVEIHLARYVLKNNTVKFDSFYLIKSWVNKGKSEFTVPQYEGEGESKTLGEGRFVSFVRVIKKEPYKTQSQSSYEWIWSDVITWNNQGKAPARCKKWYYDEPDPEKYLGNTSILSCPRTLEQAFVDRGRYTDDESCNKDHYNNEFGCKVYHKDAKHCVRTIVPSESKAGQQCCYNSGNKLMVGPPGGGSLNRVHTDTGVPYISHYFSDILPYHDCCRLSAEKCQAYYSKRPSDNGENYRPPRPAATFGDPHIITLDGVQYTFNGKGEYSILNIGQSGFTLQGRMEQPKDASTTQINATVYTAFAMKENGSDTVQIQLRKQGMTVVLVNGKPIGFHEEKVINFENVMIIKYQNVSKYAIIFKSGVSVIVEGFEDLLQMMVLVPEMYKGNTSGLLGFWNDDATKEFLLPNGTFVNTSSNAHTIHYEYGLKWATNAKQTIFHYDFGKSFSTYYNPNFVPKFLDQENLKFEDANLEKEARLVCGDSIQCLFDVMTTKKTSIGKASRSALSQFKAVLNVTETEECAPLDSNLPNVLFRRKDSKNGIHYRFQCNPNYVLKGSDFLSCEKGIWSGKTPTCVDIKDSDPLSILHKVLIGFGGAAIFIVAVVLVACCLFKIRQREKRKTAMLEERREQRAKEEKNFKTDPVLLSFPNSAYIADSQLGSN